jgi:hypothetical protein
MDLRPTVSPEEATQRVNVERTDQVPAGVDTEQEPHDPSGS